MSRIKRLSLGGIVLLILSLTAFAEDGEWQEISSPFTIGVIPELSIGHYSNSTYIFAADSSDYGTLWKTDDDGLSWSRSHDLTGYWHARVVAKETDARYAWTLVPTNGNETYAGPYYSTNGGQSWDRKDNGLTGSKNLKAMAVDQSNSELDTVYIGGLGVESNDYAKIWKTTNAGTTWSRADIGIPDDEAGVVFDLSVCEDNPQVVYAAYHTTVTASKDVYVSTNGGTSWFDCDMPNNASARAVCVDPNDPIYAYVAEFSPSEGRLWEVKFSDGFDDPPIWTELESGWGRCQSIRVDNSGNVYFAMHGERVWAVRYDRTEFEYLPTGGGFIGDLEAWSVAIDPLDDSIVCVGGAFMFYYSDDFAYSFEERTKESNPMPLSYLDVDLPAVCAHSPGSGLLFKTSDNSLTEWTLRWPYFATPANIQRDWFHTGYWYTGDAFQDEAYPNGHVYYSWDNGDNWGTLGSLQYQVYCVMPDTSSDYLYCAGHPYWEPGRFHWSSNNGSSWTSVQIIYNTDVRAIDIRPNGTDTLLAGDFSAGVYRSTDRGGQGSWEEINTGLTDTHARSVKYCPGQSNIALVGTTSGVFKSLNVNASSPSWSASNYGGTTEITQAMDFHPDDNSIIVLSANDDGQGLNFISADTGRSWIAMPNLPNNLLIYDIASDIDYPDTFYAGTDSGLFKLENFVKSGTIASNETWGPGLVVINGDVTVNSGVKLTIAAGTEVQVVYDFDKDQSGASSSKSELIVKGILAAKGTSNDPIVFKSSKPSSPGAGDWFAIRADSGSYDTLEYCTIQHADYAVKAYKPSGLSVQHCYLNDISTAGIYMQYPPTTARVRYSKLETCGTYGLYCANNYFTATSDTILETRYGIYFQGNGNPTFEDCYMTYPHPFLYLSYYGIYAVGSSAPASATPTVSGCFIRGFDQGGIYLELVDGQGTVSETRIDTCATYGIYLKNSDAGILGGSGSYNRAAGNTYGLYVSSSSSPTVRRTKFWENVSYGIYVTSGCSGDFGQNNANQQGQNSFHTGSGIYYWDFYNAGGTDLDAYYNFWGESRPNSSQIVGAKYDPYLSSDPLPAKISPNDMVGLPEDFSLATVYPNPFNPTTVLKVNLAAPQRVTVKIFNIVGQEVIMLYDGTMNSGEHELVWDGRNSRGEMASTGVYLFSVQSPESRKTLKATLLK